uniref:Factor of DNA methylation 4-like n=1 Tax=Tanacetum cinerariifolium TaxID=118510 RepID=A0A6L2K537_TANCI|nr:factor of DNA methylation 4-like [Tanacetum cinerariifolium]
MSQSRKATSINDPELEKYKDGYYRDLRDGRFKVWHTDEILKCFCPESRDYSHSDLLRHANRIVKDSRSAMLQDKARHLGLVEYLKRNHNAKNKGLNSAIEIITPKQETNEERFVWSWKAVVANIPVESRYGKYSGDNGKKLKEKWEKHGYHPLKVHAPWSRQGHSGLAVVEFGSKLDQFSNALKFVKDFEVNKCGTNDYRDQGRCKDDKMYAWMATDEDYNSTGLVSDYFKKNGDLKTLSAVQKDIVAKNTKVILGFETLIDEKSKKTEEIKSEISRTYSELVTVRKQKEITTENFKRGLELETEKHVRLQQISFEHELRKKQLEELKILEQKKANERMWKLFEEQMREKEKLHHRIIELQKKIDEKQRLELEIEQIKGDVEVMKHMTDEDLEAKKRMDKFEGHDFRRWQKKMHFLLTTLKMVYVLTTPMSELLENDTNVESAKGLWDSLNPSTWQRMLRVRNSLILGQYTQHGLKMDESISVSSIIDKFPPSWKDFNHTLKHGKDDLSLVQLGSHLRIEDSLRAQDSDNGKGKEVDGTSCGKTGHFKRDCRSGNKKNANASGSGKGSKDQSQDQGQNLVPVWNIFIKYYVSLIPKAFYVQFEIAWWIDSGATTHVCKDRCWFKTYEPVEDGSVLYMGDDHFAPVHEKESVVMESSSGI